MKFNKYCNHYKFILIIVVVLCGITSCKKFLDKKPDKLANVPSSLSDLQALLDNSARINESSAVFGEALADNYYLTASDYNQYISDAQYYTWNKDAIPYGLPWNVSYPSPVYYSNLALTYLPLVESAPSDAALYNQIQGSALFIRAYSFFELAQLYCKPFSSTAATDPGLLLKQSADINEVVGRASVQTTYDQIINDLKQSIELLPVRSSVITRPCKIAAYAELARVYLSMRDYTNAGTYAKMALDQQNALLNYNGLIPVQSPPIKVPNVEVIYYSYNSAQLLKNDKCKVDSNLYKSYSQDDLRKKVYFNANTGAKAGTYYFWGSYAGQKATWGTFSGLTTSELLLIRAECYAKNGNSISAMFDLNTLLKTRWTTGKYVDLVASDASNALQKIRIERRKELVFRNQRWTDLRRYNLEDSTITLKRIINGKIYTLPPNDNRWVMQIPTDEIIKRGIVQNPR
ncbi:RagB/SusD family nutrient uptake outer membrane protein [Mucilaginibacter paludis]|uniref:RagB/SusD domain-containing protein n=1 Tax=Mucilaginibacter paludis DSM 18603 TaxID=714943 RepID=H1Y3G1_9SPHI|nr:RagB/SusD family nutrient uptake outer membrane protein [Mucilaginibacter paludis]EHQ29729.1 hypothetical protein Mucpa_5660 [Mucilaginibacter paludis DSM 18603]